MAHTLAYTVLEKSAPTRRYTLGIVYEPDSVDTQGEFAKAEDIEAAAWDFLARLQVLAKSGALLLASALKADKADVEVDITDLGDLLKGEGLDDQHLQVDEPLGTIVESYVAPCDLNINGQPVKKGAWLLGVRWTEGMFEKIHSGERTGLSMFGHATRVEA